MAAVWSTSVLAFLLLAAAVSMLGCDSDGDALRGAGSGFDTSSGVCFTQLAGLAVEEGEGVGSVVNTSSPSDCEAVCSATASCQSFSFCPQWGSCWMKTKAFFGGEPTRVHGECLTYYEAPCPAAVPTQYPTVQPTPAPAPAPTSTPSQTPATGGGTHQSVAPTQAPTAGGPIDWLAPGYHVSGVKGTMWADATDSGGCEMPTAAYSVQHAMAIGDAQANLLLSAQSSNHLCGQVVSVNCGGSTVKAVVASICNKNAHNCGVDLIRKSWDLATGNTPPGITDCTMTLDDSPLLASSEVQCFFRPSGEYGNRYHASVGVFNTGGRLPASATLNGITGSFNGDSAYFDFNGDVGVHSSSSTVPFVVTFTDGSSMTTTYGSCAFNGQAYIWFS
mmetsp:Transcript_6102/g.16499  ORF Transcript_6102/g.16499 Transcript_6102/m.16499 type:complete len:390 (-) Transcript_6102:291-1460(-)